MKYVYQTITDLIGNTPILELHRFRENNHFTSHILAKLEYFNPAGSVKDRIASAMIEEAQSQGLLNRDSVIIEPTSGNTGIGLAAVAASKGYKLIIVMPEGMSEERIKILKAYGARGVLSPKDDGMKGQL